MNTEITNTENITDPFGLRKRDFRIRKPERSEMFTEEEARAYTEGCDYPESADDFMLALEIFRTFGQEALSHMRILDAMCGPGRLGRELLNLGAQSVTFHDGAPVMLQHAESEALKIIKNEQNIQSVQSEVSTIPLPDNSFDLVICHNSTHQLSSVSKLRQTMEEFLRLTAPAGQIVIADYQRESDSNFKATLEKRLQWTKPSIVPLLIPTFEAAFSKDEFRGVLASMKGVATWSVTDAEPPMDLSQNLQTRIESDPVKGHLLDFSRISLRAILEKENL